jgi:CheY-like chemotaxis protein
VVGRAFREAGVSNPLIAARDGEAAVRYLKGEGEYADREQFPIPQLILLDLDLPGMNGFEVLAWLRQDPTVQHLPVVVLTSSTYSPDLTRAYQLGANSFLTKPTDFTELIREVKHMSDFWLYQRRAYTIHRYVPRALRPTHEQDTGLDLQSLHGSGR